MWVQCQANISQPYRSDMNAGIARVMRADWVEELKFVILITHDTCNILANLIHQRSVGCRRYKIKDNAIFYPHYFGHAAFYI